MDPSLKIRQDMALGKYSSMNPVDQHRVLYHIDTIAKDRGYDNQMDLKQKKPYLWDQMCADVVIRLFP
jgi:hypothetical protein